jgi:hypothetical protein
LGGADQRVEFGQQDPLDLGLQPVPGLHSCGRLAVPIGRDASAREPVLPVHATEPFPVDWQSANRNLWTPPQHVLVLFMSAGAMVDGVMDLAEVRPTAWMDRWTVLDFCDQLALFGFAPELRRRSGLSWVRSAPLVRLDLRFGRAITEDGVVYGLGRRFRLDDLTDEEGWAALQLQLERRFGGRAVPPDDLAAAKWLATRAMARWLDVVPPSRNDHSLVERFLDAYGELYLARRRDRQPA